jgi:hypothetical protein
MTVPEAGELRRWLRQARRARKHRTARQILGDLYEVLLAVVVAGGFGFQAGRRILVAAGVSRTAPHATTLGWLLAGLTLLLAGLALRGLAAVGPLIASPAARTWVLSAPVDRSGLLAPRHRWALVAGTGVGLVYGGAAGLVGGSGMGDFWLCAALGALLALAGTGHSVRRQGGKSAWLSQIAVLAVVAGLLVGAVVAVLGLAGREPPPVPSPGWLIVAVACAALAAGLGLAGSEQVRSRIGRAALSDASGLAGATRAAVTWFDSTLLTGLLAERRWRKVAAVRSTRLRPGSLTTVLLAAELRRLTRSRPELATWAALLLAPYALAAVLPPVWVPVVQLVAATLAADRLAGGLRTVCRGAAIRRALGGSDRQLRLTHLVLPAVAALVWSALSLPSVLSAGPLLGVLYPAAGATVVIYRMATRRSMDYNAAATLDPHLGILPIGLFGQLVRGPDVLLVLAAARLLFG